MVTVDIDDQKYELLETRAKEKGFENTEKYIDHLLSQIVEKIGKEKSSVSDEEEKEVKKKLEELGYL